VNVFTFSGNLGNDCRVNTVGGTDVCNFSVACTSGFGDKKQTHWIDCAYWGNGGKAVSPYLKKGQAVVVSGEVSLTPATDKYPAKIVVRVNSLTLAGGKREDAPQKPAAAPATAVDDGGDIPF
jgi:single-stranded DNA-binding protein